MMNALDHRLYGNSPHSKNRHSDSLITNTPQANTLSGGITEVLLPNAASAAFFFPSLALLSHQSSDRWLTWLAPKGLCKSQLQNFGFDLRKTRFIYPRNPEHTFWLFWQALAEGNSHTVVATMDALTDEQLRCLERGAKSGLCNGLLVHERG